MVATMVYITPHASFLAQLNSHKVFQLFFSSLSKAPFILQPYIPSTQHIKMQNIEKKDRPSMGRNEEQP